jgi:hypothetical protein
MLLDAAQSKVLIIRPYHTRVVQRIGRLERSRFVF